MSMSAIAFYVIAAFILFSAVLSVTAKKIFRSAIWLLSALVGIAGLYFWMQMEFIAAVQIAVYVGGIVVLIIFSIFLTQQSGKEMPSPLPTRKIFSALAVLAGFILSYILIWEHPFQSSVQKNIDVSVAEIGSQMLSTTAYGYVLPFEVVSILLLAAMIGCIVIAMKSPLPGTRDEAIAGKEDAPY